MPSILEGVFSSSEDELNKMLVSLVGMPKDQIESELSAIKSRVEEVAQTIPTKGNKGDKGDKGDQGIQGPKGEPGRDGRDGFIGKDGKQGVAGQDGKDGKDGVSIVDVNVAFDNHLVITLSDGTEIDAGVIGSIGDNLQNVVANYVSNGANGTLIYKGLWNASTNTPTLSLSSSDAGAYYVVSVAGSTNLSGITDWQVNDWAIFNGTEWQKIDNSDLFNPSAVAITGGSINGTTIGAVTASTGRFTSVTTPSVTATTNDLTLSAISTGVVKFNTLNGLQAQINDTTSTAVNYATIKGSSSGSTVDYGVAGSDGGITLALKSKGSGNVSLYTNGGNQLQFTASHTASAVNYVQVTGAATGANPSLSAQGSDASVNLQIAAKGGGTVSLSTNGVGSAGQFVVSHTSSAVNYYTATGSAAGFSPRLFAQGNDTNIPLALITKGTGAIDLAAGSSGVNISNGGTVTALTRTNVGAGYTSVPTITISAPTTAGGVQATASVTQMFASTATVSSGGTGYTVGDVLTVVGGTGTAATLTVATLSGSAVATVTFSNNAGYTALPSNPVSVTGGSGSGATFTLGWSIGGSFTITNAGSGYIEQPTITFSGGGGSGAAAYASVGSATTVKGIGSATGALGVPQSIDFTTPAGMQSTILNVGDGTRPLTINGGSAGSVASAGIFASIGALHLSSNASNISFYSGGRGATEQLRVSHTASAVNYVQVTGAATGGVPLTLAQGSDTNVNMAFASKGTGYLAFRTNTSTEQFRVYNTTSAVNRIEITGSIASAAPLIKSEGTDTNIDLALTPKGTGVVRFGTHTATADVAISGYIEIKDSGGTIRKLAVIT